MSAHQTNPPPAQPSLSEEKLTRSEAPPDPEDHEPRVPRSLAAWNAARDALAEEAAAFAAGERDVATEGCGLNLRRSAGVPAKPPPALRARRGRRAWEVIVEGPADCEGGGRRVSVIRGASHRGRIVLRRGERHPQPIKT